ncbi:MAG TPA: radical SAM protein [Nitrospirae bacterium]|nr:radical SAM protein [Nitrospirota bacterium]
MRILLIKPSCTVYTGDPTQPSATLPFGIAYLASYLLSKGEDVMVIDALSEGIKNIEQYENRIRVGLPDKEIERRIRDFKPDIVAITSMFTAFYLDTHNLAEIVKKINPEIKVILGGAHVSISPELSLKDPNIDIVVKGEGEITLWEIVKALKDGRDYSNIPGSAARIDSRIKNNPARPSIKDLDILPFPAYHLLPMEKYFETAKGSPYLMDFRMCGIISSRGCPGDCSYCSIHAVWGNRWNRRTAENVVDEMEFLMKTYNIKEFSFLDDSVACSKERMGKICDEIIRRDLKIHWSTPNGVSHWTLDEALLDRMKASGCYRLTFGIESGNLKTREFIGWKKNFKLEQGKRIIDYANKIGLWTISTFIIGFPYEDEKSINDTIDFAVNSNTDFAAFFLLMPFPGTKAYSTFKKEGLLDFDDLLDPSVEARESQYEKLGATLAQKGCQTKHFTPEELQNFLSKAYAIFLSARFKRFLNPLHILRKINSLKGLKYVLRLVLVGIKLKLSQLKYKEFSAHMINRVNKDNLKDSISASKY